LGDIGEFAFKHQLFLRTYRWRRIDPVPCTPLRKPLRECRVAVVSSAGFVLPGQEPFDSGVR
jgi:D-proline reductase (dithiol) PrdB